MAALSRSVYLARLRRAFLLRVHPDRFRTQDASVRSDQARLVQALNDRWSFSDFAAYAVGSAPSSPPFVQHRNFRYALEQRDGSLLYQTIRLDDSVDNILESMAEALRLSGLVIPAPAPPKKASEEANNVVWSSSSGQGVDHRFDINTSRGRNLLAFCHSLDRNVVETCRASRLDANSAALVGRRLFQFQTIDGTSLHWSSASMTMLLSRLTAFYEEYHDRFHVESFYPLRLVFSSDDMQESLDLIGGVLYLNPADNSIQWLDVIRTITSDSLHQLKKNRQVIQNCMDQIQSAWGVAVRKGHSCSSLEYMEFLLSCSSFIVSMSREDMDGLSSSAALMLEPLLLTVEGSQACRRSVVTPEGHVRVGATMSPTRVLESLSHLAESARAKRLEEKLAREKCQESIHWLQWEFGLNKVHRAGVRISLEEFQKALLRILHTQNEQDRELLKLSFAGNSLGVSRGGQFCHIGDDGSIIIPHDWE